MSINKKLSEEYKIVTGLAGIVPSTSTPDYVSLKGAVKMTAVISVQNGTTVTGSAITLKQATAVAGTGEKELAFTTMGANVDISATDTLVATAVTSNTFTPPTTNSLATLYVIEIDPTDLDMANNFDCVRVGTANAVAQTVSVMYYLHSKKQSATPPAAITD